MIFSTKYPSPIGELTLACDENGLVGLWLSEQKYHGDSLGISMIENSGSPLLIETRKWLDGYFAGQGPDASKLPLAPRGSAFRERVWQILCEIPYGEVTSYGVIAKRIAAEQGMAKMSSRAVGGAVGHNPISIIIPCHRVVGSSGSLTGYGGGIQRKIKLLELEGVDISRFRIPTTGTAL